MGLPCGWLGWLMWLGLLLLIWELNAASQWPGVIGAGGAGGLRQAAEPALKVVEEPAGPGI